MLYQLMKRKQKSS